MTKYFYENCLEPLPDLRNEFSQKVEENANLTWALLGPLDSWHRIFNHGSDAEALRALQADVKAFKALRNETTLAALSQNLGPEPLKALTEVIQTAFATTPPADEVAFSQLMELMSDFGMSQQCQDQVAEAISAPIDFETIQSDPKSQQHPSSSRNNTLPPLLSNPLTQWQTWVVETL